MSFRHLGKIRSFVNMASSAGLHTLSGSALWMKTGAGIMIGHLKHLSQPRTIKESIYHICPFNTMYSLLLCSITAVQ